METLAGMETKLKRWRNGRKVEDVAALIGVTAAMWSRWENGRREVPGLRVLDIEAATGISRHDLRPDIFGERKRRAVA